MERNRMLSPTPTGSLERLPPRRRREGNALRVGPCLLGLLYAAATAAQQSATFRISGSALNEGGHPESGVVLTSPSFRVTLDMVGEPVEASSLAGASFRLDAGFVAQYPPPGEVSGVHFSSRDSLVWSPDHSARAYNAYRDLLSNVSTFGVCWQQGLLAEAATETVSPVAGSCWFYLVTAINHLAEEGTKGFQSTGQERPNLNPCP